MNIFTDLNEVKKDKNTIITVGTFDGVHLGHKKILHALTQSSFERNFVITFDPHPRRLLSNTNEKMLLSTLAEKKDLLKQMNVGNLLVIKFSREFSEMRWDGFIRDFIVDKIGASEIIIGHDHKFGRNRSGDEGKLRELGNTCGFRVRPVEAVVLDGEIINSTKIRNALSAGDMEKANRFLGRNYSFEGIVIQGMRRGRELGFPTANIRPDNQEKLLPARGVYFAGCNVGNREYFGVMNLGIRPTFNESAELIPEIHLFGFQGDIYGQKIKVSFIKKLRDEIKFGSKENLIAQIQLDITEGLKLKKQLTN